MSRVLEDSQFIALNSRDVQVNEEGCNQVAAWIEQQLDTLGTKFSNWQDHELHPKLQDSSTLDWIFLIDILNFSFWSDADTKDSGNHPARFGIRYKGKLYMGYWSLCAAVNKALDNSIPITTPSFYADEVCCPDDLIASIFASDTEEQIPLLSERIRIMRASGKALVKYYGGRFVHLLEKCNHSAQKFLEILLRDFPDFRDISFYKGRECHILKRAQILIAETWACFHGQGYGQFDDIDSITMFADYRVPQILWQLGCLDYSPEFGSRLRKSETIAHNDPMEIEMRGCSIWAVELIRLAVNRPNLNAIMIDFFLWDLAKEWQTIGYSPNKERALSSVPSIRVRSIYY
ncbi:eukaryotic protein [Schizosaccharomyces cryophilus OY26]|uniref:Queuosine 5'-phosphate N-glycosylase/hydrolase n=1 Tax=Schizosaccharomyces cryophilus (strain OY26 / ATCC MYA-4695 / CBS 11777 / NBRC 106824 / NRRL Y48691) TaxID=653667 RepID=S9XI79_SCHCR|nr:uncharacterized protein SPOG_03883 [Schizosaccharomyces cryophilus OY26]EPY53356.1 eukaryotic protein [Schizosaccharomyces cryophilus OY26]